MYVFTPKILVYCQGRQSFYKCLIKTIGTFISFFYQDATLGMKGTIVRTSRIFLYLIWSGFAHIPTSGILADGNWELHRGSMGFLKLMDQFCSIPVPNFNSLWKKPYSIYICELQNFQMFFKQSQRKFYSLCPITVHLTESLHIHVSSRYVSFVPHNFNVHQDSQKCLNLK